jgi:2-polyprenyl-6-methoxyphenol hydroxylase-like FAD-dependent oxidoreductase
MNGGPMDVIIIGAGIGGLTAALALHQVGINARVYESAEDIRELGVGINLLPHATKILDAYGVLDALAAIAIETKDLTYFNKFGQTIWSEPRGIEAGYRWPQLSIHRGALQTALLRAVHQRLGAERIFTGHHLTRIGPSSAGRLHAHFISRATGAPVAAESADLLIGADGIHSVTRSQFYPSEGPPKWSGAVVWRAVSETPPFLSGRSMVVVGHTNRFIAYPISKPHAVRGVSLVNWVAEIAMEPNKPYRREDWNRRGQLGDVLPQFENFCFDWIDVPAIMRAAEAIYEFPRLDRDPLQRWTFGRVTLLGDAAHPMYPMGSNGASQAILDASALADALGANSDLDQALAAYEAARRPAATEVVISNRNEGPAQILAIVEERAPHGFDNIEAVISSVELAEISSRYKRLAGFDQVTVNANPLARRS